MCEIQATRQEGKNKSVQHFANKISKLVRKVNHGATDPDAVDREKTREFVYKLLPFYMSKMVAKTLMHSVML